MLGFILVLFIAGMISSIFSVESKLTFMLGFMVVAIVLIIYIINNKKWKEYGFIPDKINKKELLYILPLFIIAFMPLITGVDMSIEISIVFYTITYMVFVAFVEETIYRGIIFNALESKGNKFAIVLSAIFFGASHLLSISGGKDIVETSYQVIFAIIMGMVLALVILLTRNIYFCIAYHLINNVIVSISLTSVDNDRFISYFIMIFAIVYMLLLIKIYASKSRSQNVKV